MEFGTDGELTPQFRDFGPQTNAQRPAIQRRYKRRPLRAIVRAINLAITHTGSWVGGVAASSLILSILLFIVVNFYIFSSIVNLDSFFYIFLILSLLTDGMFIFIQLFRRPIRHENVSFNPHTLSIVIASYNGEKVIANTLKDALKHVPAKQILVVSDASTDGTAEVARQHGVRVIENTSNLNKPFSISRAMKFVNTKYVLLLDDDTLVGDIIIPTSLLDEGYSAVSFNVMPVAESGLLNELQRFEYRQSMELSHSARANVGAVGNVSGAIGLYHTKDLIAQASRHSGQFAGEDEQRTLLTHMGFKGKGITHISEVVHTQAPDKLINLYRQRAMSWSLAVPELFVLYWRTLLSPKYHYLLKAEKAYQLYFYLTDPLRMLFFWALFLRPSNIIITYAFYLFLNGVIWIKLRRRDPFAAVLFYPLYSLFLTVCRFVGYFYWLIVKLGYLLRGTHKLVNQRWVFGEYMLVFAVVIASWAISGRHFVNDVKLFNKVRTHRLEETTREFNYESVNAYGSVPTVQITPAPAGATYLIVVIEKGDTNRAIAHKAINQYLSERPHLASQNINRSKADESLTAKLPALGEPTPGGTVSVEISWIEQALTEGGVQL